MFILGIIFIIVSFILTIYNIYSLKHIHTINTNIDKENTELLEQKNQLTKEVDSEKFVLEKTKDQIQTYKDQLSDIQNNIGKTLDTQKELSRKAFENYCEILEKNYEEKEDEYANYELSMQEAYSDLQLKLLQRANECREELDKIQATRAAAIQAQLREKEIENNLSFYCLEVSDIDKADIAKLETLKPSLNKPRILSMLIWQTWFQKPLKALSANVIGVNDKTGIYKITNIKTKECYIGQAVNIKDRWVEHVKCGLGIDTPAANKLYKAMQDYGLWNFSFEILEECPRDQLNEKERYYINLYQSKDYGYNITAGNK